MSMCCFQNPCVQLFFVQGRDFFLLFFQSEAWNGFLVKTMSSEGLSFLHFWCNVDTLSLCLRIRAPRLSLILSKPTETVLKKQLQRFDQLSWVFQRCYSLVSYIFLSVSSFFHPVKKSVSVDGLWSTFPQICLLMQNW